jgi:astacin (peptidase family M12A)
MLGTNRTWKDDKGNEHTLALNEPTMNLDPINVEPKQMGKGQYGYGTVLHEFGHAIGLVHEHLRPDRPIKFVSDQDLYTFYQNNQGWGTKAVDLNIINVAKGVVGTLNFDFKSIMLYSFPQNVLASNDPMVKELAGKAGKPYPVNSDLSEDDKTWIQLLYPKSGPRGVLTEIKG